jgi:hypothetical protein
MFFDALERRGTWVLLVFAAALALFLALHLARMVLPLVLAPALEAALRRLDRWTTRRVLRPPAKPVNHFYAYTGNDTGEEDGFRVFFA